MKLTTPWILAAALAGATLGLFVERRLHSDPSPPAVPSPAKTGSPMPALALTSLEGRPTPLSADPAGRPLLLNFWASWCAPCREEMPELARFSREQGTDGIQVIGIALDTPEAIRAFLAQIPVDYPILLDSPGPDDASSRLGNTQGVLPYSVLVDADGRIAKQKTGPFATGEIGEWTR